MNAHIFIVLLRCPGKGDARRDPFWEFGSFGCTSCHRHNLLNPGTCRIKDGDRLAFVQGGNEGSRLLLITPPVRRIDHRGADGSGLIEVRWNAEHQPFKYGCSAPLVANNSQDAATEFPRLLEYVSRARRSTWAARLASRFRARAKPLERELAVELVAVFERRWKGAAVKDLIQNYEDALPRIDQNAVEHNRKQVYRKLLIELQAMAPSKCGGRTLQQLAHRDQSCSK